MTIPLWKILPAEEAQLRVHGNGFIQAETKDGNKIHIWHPQVPRQVIQTLQHNHNHAFHSTVVIGALTMSEFNIKIDSDGEWQQYQAVKRKGKDTYLSRIDPFPVRRTNIRHFTLQEGSEYDYPLNMHLFHEVRPISPIVVTYIERTGETDKEEPIVLVPRDYEPDNRFDRYGHYEIAKIIYHKVIDMLAH